MKCKLPATAATLRLPLIKRLRGADAEQGAALLFALMAIFIATSLSLLLLGTILSQTTATQFDRKNARAINAAESGVDAALSQIRAAKQTADASGNTGNKALLPCSVSGTAQSDSSMTYTVTIMYFASDPSVQPKTWRAGNALTCTPGSGTTVVPHYALLVSDGTGPGVPGLNSTAGDRRLESVYDFSIRNENVSSGVIRAYQDSSTTKQICWDAGASPFLAGDVVKTAICDSTSSQQLWAWRSDFTMVLVATLKPVAPATVAAPMCASLSGTSSITLASCSATVTTAAAVANNLKFGYNDNGHFFVRPVGSTTTYCPGQATNNAAPGSLTVTNAICGTGQNSQNSWQPSATVGAGSVGNKGDNVSDVDGIAMQWVNYQYFGECFDATNQSVTFAFNILYPCKQDPNATPAWNEVFTWKSSTQQMTVNNGSTYCVTDVATNAAAPRYVGFSSCGSSNNAQKWVVNRLIPGNYTDSYTIKNVNSGLCLSAVPGSGINENQWPHVVTEACDGSGKQKWNAPPDPSKSTQRDTVEINN